LSEPVVASWTLLRGGVALALQRNSRCTRTRTA